jgi:hypothetical protein|tara:strand:- start:506 stop:778 length:273 start_codon:yes stop_codon:yes gene_type:complete
VTKKKKGLSAEKNSEEQIQQGNAADAVLTSPVFIEAFEILEEKYINSWLSSGIPDKDHRETQFLSLRVLSEVRLELESMVNGGKIAKNNL